MKYESEILNVIIAIEGHTSPSIHYESECIEHAVNEMDEGIADYQSELLNNYLKYITKGIPVSSVTTVSNDNIISSYDGKYLFYASKPSYDGSMFPSNLFNLYVAKQLSANKSYRVCLTQLEGSNTKLSVKDNLFNTIGQESNYSTGKKEIIIRPTTTITNFISLRIEGIEGTTYTRHFTFYNLKIYEL